MVAHVCAMQVGPVPQLVPAAVADAIRQAAASDELLRGRVAPPLLEEGRKNRSLKRKSVDRRARGGDQLAARPPLVPLPRTEFHVLRARMSAASQSRLGMQQLRPSSADLANVAPAQPASTLQASPPQEAPEVALIEFRGAADAVLSVQAVEPQDVIGSPPSSDLLSTAPTAGAVQQAEAVPPGTAATQAAAAIVGRSLCLRCLKTVGRSAASQAAHQCVESALGLQDIGAGHQFAALPAPVPLEADGATTLDAVAAFQACHKGVDVRIPASM